MLPGSCGHTRLQQTRRAILALAAAAPFSSARSQGSPWPQRPITLVLGFAPGGPNDLIARLLAKRLGELLAQPIVVENRPGANGNIAAGLVARAAPDGTTFLYNSSSLALSAALYAKPPVDPVRDLVAVNGTATLPLVCVVAASNPVNDFRQWAAAIKANPGRYNYGSPGNGNLAHVAAAMVLKANGLEAVHVPYKGSSEALQGLLAGATQFQFDAVNSPLSLIRGGRLKPLFVTSSQRSALFPEVRTLAEDGLTTVDASAWQGVMAPISTPAPILDRMAREITAAMADPQIKAALAAQGAYEITSTPAQYRDFLNGQVRQFKRIGDEAGIRLE